MGYYAGYQSSLYPVGSLDVTKLTHIVVARVYPNGGTTLVQNFDMDDVNGPAMAKTAASRAHAGGKKAILMLGGAGAYNGMVTAASAANRASFVTNILAAMDAYGYDGIDIDWEPIASADFANVQALASALRSARPNIILTLAVGWVGSTSGAADAFYGQISATVDRINMMNYGMSGAWSGWQSWHSSALSGESSATPSSVASSVKAYLAAGVPAAKLGVGAGFYGMCWRGSVTAPRMAIGSSSVVADDNVMSYVNIMNSYYTAGAYKYDAAAQVPYLSYPSGYGAQSCNFISYEDATSLTAKGRYVVANGLGGIILWTINEGYFPSATDKNPLLTALAQGME